MSFVVMLSHSYDILRKEAKNLEQSKAQVEIAILDCGEAVPFNTEVNVNMPATFEMTDLES